MADELPLHIAWIKRLPCAECAAPAPSEAHHRVGAGMGLRSHDVTAIPLCRQCHHDFHSLSGSFKGKTRQELRDWHSERLFQTKAKVTQAVDEIDEAEIPF